jgi:pimeloyl-ACP methyl ester carboxylesterase
MSKFPMQKWVIEMELQWFGSVVLALIDLLLHYMPIFVLNWVYIFTALIDREGECLLRYEIPKIGHFLLGLVSIIDLGYLDEMTDKLDIKQFFVIANSFGTSYALAMYDTLKHKILGSLRFMAVWAPSNLPCMPSSYAVQRSLPTKFFRALTSLAQSPTVTSLAYQSVPMQMGKIGSREKVVIHDLYSKEILDVMNADYLAEGFKSYELDWMLALEVQKPMGFTHRSIKCAIKCWHGMEDSITPLGAAMWMQREMDHFLLYAVEGATHNIHLDFAIAKAVFTDIAAEIMSGKAEELKVEELKVEEQKVEEVVIEEQSKVSLGKEETEDTVDVKIPQAVENVWA